MTDPATTAGYPWVRRLRRRLAGWRRNEKGATAVEFAFVIPVLALVLLGIIQFGSLLFLQNNMLMVARDAARRFATGDLAEKEVEPWVQDHLINWGITFKVSVDTPDPKDPADRDVSVGISAGLGDASIVDVGFGSALSDAEISASATMQVEGGSGRADPYTSSPPIRGVRDD